MVSSSAFRFFDRHPLQKNARCSTCDATTELQRCGGCKVTWYCSVDHQTRDWSFHKTSCLAVKQARNRLAREEKKLRALPEDFDHPGNVFEEGVGHFWGYHRTRPYMQARFELFDTLTNIQTWAATEESLSIILESLRFNRSDNQGMRTFVPYLYLRLGRDQECYDFIKWYATTGEDEDYDWGDMKNGFLDVKDANVFEKPPMDLSVTWFEINPLIALLLLKLRMIADLTALRNAKLVRSKLPQELYDHIGNLMISDVVAGNADAVANPGTYISLLRGQALDLFVALRNANKRYPSLMYHIQDELFDERPGPYSPGSPEEAMLAFQYSYAAWMEAPEAYKLLRSICDHYVSKGHLDVALLRITPKPDGRQKSVMRLSLAQMESLSDDQLN